MIDSWFAKYSRLGLPILRIGAGLYLALAHGWGKLIGGPEQWAQVGSTVINFLPVLWGLFAAFAEFFCALLLVLGLLTRPAAAILVVNMTIAATAHLTGAIGGGPEKALLYAVIFGTLFVTGPGAYSIDERFRTWIE